MFERFPLTESADGNAMPPWLQGCRIATATANAKWQERQHQRPLSAVFYFSRTRADRAAPARAFSAQPFA